MTIFYRVENRVNAIVKFVSCSMEENQMSKPVYVQMCQPSFLAVKIYCDKKMFNQCLILPLQFVIVEVLDGKWEKKVAVFDTDDFYIFGVNIRSGDVRQLLKYGDKVK